MGYVDDHGAKGRSAQGDRALSARQVIAVLIGVVPRYHACRTRKK
ncbi:MAG: hypothetical protein P8Q50_03360 [Octadecabacter sp.]|nr:hypothetical protein [Octadecabacter sp.]